MSGIRVTTFGPSGLFGAAMVPLPAGDARAYQARGHLVGVPGTKSISAPNPGGVPQDWNRALHRSSDGPPWWRPAIYYPRPALSPRTAFLPASYRSDNQMP